MLTFIQILLIICVFIGVFIAGIWLAKVTSDELAARKKIIRLAVKICLLLLAVSVIYWIVSGADTLILILSLSAFLILAIVSIKSEKSKKQKR